ncbi:MAG: NAD(+)/NADH kinase [Ruminococcus sp.]|nr:NAD(+)/NADH kinase [Ruminococcus sp.]
MKSALYPNFQKKNALSCARMVCDVLFSAGIDVFVSEEFRDEFSDKSWVQFENISTSVRTADVVIAIGGDGTILHCAKHLMGTDTRLLGINTGTLGFMAGLESDQLEKLRLLKTGEYNISERMTLDVKMPDGTVCTALNDICARTRNLKICDFEVYSDGYFIGRYRADGVLFSTPSGSTAYALSAGGPIIEPDLECVEMTMLCSHSLFSRATLFSADRRLHLRNTSVSENRSMTVCVDGESHIDIAVGEEIEIYRGRSKISFVDLIGNSFHESLCRKMMKPIK